MTQKSQRRSGESRETWTPMSRRRFVEWTGRLGLALPAWSLLVACGDATESKPSGAGSGPGVAGTKQAGKDSGMSGSMPKASPTPPQPQAAQAQPSPAAADPGTDALVTEVPAMATLVQTLGYVNQSEKPDQRCASCALFYDRQDGRGHCRLFSQGLVSTEGWCTSWVKNANAA